MNAQRLSYTSSDGSYINLPRNGATSSRLALLTGTGSRTFPCAKVPGLALAAALGTLALAGCGGGSNAAKIAADASTVTVEVPQSTASAATTSAQKPSSVTPPASASGAGSTHNGPPSASTGVPYEVHTLSMEPTYRFGTKVYYDPTRTHPRIGDVVIFYLPVGGRNSSCGTVMEGRQACAVARPGLTRMLAIKRVVGLPGDRIAIHEGRVIRNGRPEPEPPTIHCGSESGCEFPTPITVPTGAYYVMADDRQLFHEDSRLWGAVPRPAIVGIVEGG